MNHSLVNSLSAMQALQFKIDTIADNIANNDTIGFKRRDTEFKDIMASYYNQPASFHLPGRITPLGMAVGNGAVIAQSVLDLSQGSLKVTDNPLDVALGGNGMFEVDVRGERVWTRNGSFHLSPDPAEDDEGYAYLTTAGGHRVVAERDGEEVFIRIPKGYQLQIDMEGRIIAVNDANPEESESLGRLKLMRVLLPQYLESIGDQMYSVNAADEETFNLILQRIDFAAEAEDPNAERVVIYQGQLEQGNVSLTKELTDLMIAQRAYQLNSRAIQSSEMMLNLANNLRG